MMKTAATLVGFAACILVASRAPAQTCVGDCNGDGMVAINELITGVNIALGATLIVDPVGAPFVLDRCDFERYDAALTNVTSTASAPRVRASIPPAAFGNLPAARFPAASLQRSGNLVK